jgi:hypothetical protein
VTVVHQRLPHPPSTDLKDVLVEGPAPKPVMIIDKTTRHLDFLFLFSFGVWAFGCGIGGVFGPKPEIIIASSRIIHHPVLKSPLQISLPRLDPLHSYIHADLQFVCRSYRDLIHDPITVNFTIRYLDQGTVDTEKTRKNVVVRPAYPAQLTKATSAFRLFFAHIIDFDQIDFNVSYDAAALPDKVNYIVSTQYRATPSYSIVQAIARTMATLVSVLVLILFFANNSRGRRRWTTEQVETLVLVVLSIFDTNAIFTFAMLLFPSYFCVVWGAFFRSAFRAYWRVYLVALFDGLIADRLLDQHIGVYSAFFGVDFLVHMYHQLNDGTVMFDYESDLITPYRGLFELERWMDRIHIAWVVVAIFRTALSSRLRSMRRLLMYIIIIGIVLFWHGIDRGLCWHHVFIAESSLHGLVNAMWHFSIPLVFLYLFWPAAVALAEPQPIPTGPHETFFKRSTSMMHI